MKRQYDIEEVFEIVRLEDKLFQICCTYDLMLKQDSESYYIMSQPRIIILRFNIHGNKTFIDFINYLTQNKSLFPEGWQKEFEKNIVSKVQTIETWILE